MQRILHLWPTKIKSGGYTWDKGYSAMLIAARYLLLGGRKCELNS